MALTLASLLAQRDLRLSARTPLGAPSPTITWAAVTELENPHPFLGGGELVLTTGLKLRTTAAQRDFITHVHSAGVVAVGFGVGLAHQKIPGALLAQAEELSLPLIEVPYETPFIAIGKAVADALTAEHVSGMQKLFREHHLLAGALLAGKGLSGFLDELAGVLGATVSLSQYGTEIGRGVVGARGAAGARWERFPVATGMKDRCTLAVQEPFERNPIVEYAQSLIGLELSNRARNLRGARVATGHLVRDVFRGYLSDADSSTRLAAAGVDASVRHSVIIAQVASGQRSGLARMSLPDAVGHHVSAMVDERLALVVPETDDPAARARALSEYLYGAGLTATIGVGGAYAGGRGLHRSYVEALDSLRQGERVNSPRTLTLSSLLLVNDDGPMRQMAAETITPLADFDREHHGQLVETLRTYLALNGSVGAVSEELGLHRNSVRYRLAQIHELTGFNPAVTADRVHLYLALEAHHP